MCWLSVVLRHQKKPTSPPSSPPPGYKPHMNLVSMQHLYVTREGGYTVTTGPASLFNIVGGGDQVSVHSWAGAWNQKIEMSFSGVMFLFALWFTASCKRLFRRRREKGVGRPVWTQHNVISRFRSLWGRWSGVWKSVLSSVTFGSWVQSASSFALSRNLLIPK